MSAMVALRQELHAFIDILTMKQLKELEPHLSNLAEHCRKPLIETGLSGEEKEIILKGRRKLKEHPEEFMTLNALKAELRAEGKLA